jgi:TolB-like protein/DNA-binding winged helix-turn-helix (wHTH) protein/tetratricopeptide (TPR) repeat protein
MPISGDSTFARSSAQGLRRHFYEFGPYRLDALNQRLVCSGEPKAITPKTLDLLLLLVRHRERVISKRELMQELWPDTTVEEANLMQQVFVLRKILGEDQDGGVYIETVPRRGYRFAAEAVEVREESPPARSTGVATERSTAPVEQARPLLERWRRRAGAIALATCAVAAGTAMAWRYWPPADARNAPVVLAVLPFENLSTGPPQGFIGDFLSVGIPDAIITRLSTVRQFRVRPTSAVAQYQGQQIDVQDVGRRLGSQYVLVGTIRPTSDRVRVSVQLVRATDGSPVWGDQYDRPRDDLLGIEDAVAVEISSALRVQMSDADRARFNRRSTHDGAAYERYLMGRSRLRSVTEHDARQAIAEFEAARDLDPTYALAYAGLATAAAQLRVRFGSRSGYETWDALARQEAGRALQLDPDLPEAHVALAAVHRFQEYDWDTVIRESRRALNLNPSLDVAHLYLAAAYFHLGLLNEAEAEVQAARELNPENRVEPLEILGAISLFAGRTSDAVGHLSQVHDVSDSRIVRYLLGLTLYYQGDWHRAEALLETMIDDAGPLPGNARASLAAFRAAQGAHSEARALAARVASEPELIHHGAYGLGATYAQLRDPAAAVRWLSQAATTGFPCYPWYERDPLLDPIRDDARFVFFLQGLHRSWEDARMKYASGSGEAGSAGDHGRRQVR